MLLYENYKGIHTLHLIKIQPPQNTSFSRAANPLQNPLLTSLPDLSRIRRLSVGQTFTQTQFSPLSPSQIFSKIRRLPRFQTFPVNPASFPKSITRSGTRIRGFFPLRQSVRISRIMIPIREGLEIKFHWYWVFSTWILESRKPLLLLALCRSDNCQSRETGNLDHPQDHVILKPMIIACIRAKDIELQ